MNVWWNWVKFKIFNIFIEFGSIISQYILLNLNKIHVYCMFIVSLVYYYIWFAGLTWVHVFEGE